MDYCSLELQNLRQEKELTDSEIASLELEKNAIRKVYTYREQSVLFILRVGCFSHVGTLNIWQYVFIQLRKRFYAAMNFFTDDQIACFSVCMYY